jgi:hypothetical protein
MNFIGLLLHGLSAFFMYGDIIGARLLVGIALALTLEAVLVATGIALYFTTSLSVLGLGCLSDFQQTETNRVTLESRGNRRHP